MCVCSSPGQPRKHSLSRSNAALSGAAFACDLRMLGSATALFSRSPYTFSLSLSLPLRADTHGSRRLLLSPPPPSHLVRFPVNLITFVLFIVSFRLIYSSQLSHLLQTKPCITILVVPDTHHFDIGQFTSFSFNICIVCRFINHITHLPAGAVSW